MPSDDFENSTTKSGSPNDERQLRAIATLVDQRGREKTQDAHPDLSFLFRHPRKGGMINRQKQQETMMNTDTIETTVATIATPHIVEAWFNAQGTYGKDSYCFIGYEDEGDIAFQSSVWGRDRAAAAKEIEFFILSLTDSHVLSPDWADYVIVWRDAKDLQGY